MKWSIKICQIAGISIYVHWTFLILLAWIVAAHAADSGDMSKAVTGVVFVLAIFGCIVLHELGHALTAKRFGIRTRDITLLPIGGVARLERMPEDPTQELWVALAGPAVNIVIALVLFLCLWPTGGLQALSSVEQLEGSFFAQLMLVNVVLVVFNLLPAFPMDGGRVLRAVLAHRVDYVTATQTAATLGQMMAIFFGVLGFFVNWFLLFIALFVYLGAEQESHMVQMRAMLGGVSVREAMVTRFRTLASEQPLSDVIDELLSGEQQDFPVVADGRLAGILTRAELLNAVGSGKTNSPVAEVMQADCKTVDELEMLQDVFARMQEQQCSTVPVTRNGELTGIITLENVGEWIMIQTALRQGKARRDVQNIFRPA